jgi:hypothetical protein
MPSSDAVVWAWNWLAAPSILTAILTVPLVALVLRAGRKRANLVLAFALGVNGVAGIAGFGVAYLTDDLHIVRPLVLLTQGAEPAMLFSYLLLLGELRLPLLRVLRTRAAGAIAVVLSLAGLLFPFLRPALYAPSFVHASYAPWVVVPGAAALAFVLVGALVLAFSLTTSLVAWMRARKGSVERERAASYALAFGVRDGGILLGLILLYAVPETDLTDMAGVATSAVAVTASLVLLGYGILRTQLFDIDLKLRKGVERVLLGGVLLAVFFVVAQVVANLLNDRLGLLAGGIAAGLAVFALLPMQRLAERVAAAATPGIRTDSAYLAYRRMMVYRAAVEASEHPPAEANQAVLAALRRELGISDDDAEALHRELAPPVQARP